MKKILEGQYAYVENNIYELIYIDGEYIDIPRVAIRFRGQFSQVPEGFIKKSDYIYVKDIKKEEIEYAFNCRTYCMFNGIRCWVNSELDDGRVWLMALIDIRNKEEVEKVLKLGFKKDETGDPRDPGTYSGAFNKDDLSEFIYEKKAIPGLPFKE